MRHGAVAAVMFVLASASVTAANQQASPDFIRVHVFTASADSSTSSDRQIKEREDSADDLREALQATAGRLEMIQLVEDQDRADVVIEVLSREEQMMSRAPTAGNLGSRRMEPVAPRERRVFVRLTVPAVDHTDDIEGLDRGGWRRVAENVAVQIDAWIRTNLDAIRATRR